MHMNNHNEEMRAFDEKEYVAKEACLIEGRENEIIHAKDLRCIDDRDMRRGDDVPPYAIPGAGLGAVMDMIAAAYKAAKDAGNSEALDVKELFQAGKKVLEELCHFTPMMFMMVLPAPAADIARHRLNILKKIIFRRQWQIFSNMKCLMSVRKI